MESKYVISILLSDGKDGGIREIFFRHSSNSCEDIISFENYISYATKFDSEVLAGIELNSNMIRLAWWIDHNANKHIMGVNICEVNGNDNVIRREKKL